MGIESFPRADGEKDSSENIEDGGLAEELSYDEHMAELRDSWSRANAAELSKPSLKDRELSENIIYSDNSEVVEAITRKIQEGGALNKEDVSSLIQDRLRIHDADQVNDFLDAAGIDDGEEFDVMLPGVLFDKNGKPEETPLSVSFKNKEGDYTIARFSKTKDGKLRGISYSGDEKSGTNVGYHGAGDSNAQTRSHISLENGEIFKY